MTTGYHNVRFWRVDPALPWQSTGANDRLLKPMCDSVGAGLIPVLYVKCMNGCVVKIRAKYNDLYELIREYHTCRAHGPN